MIKLPKDPQERINVYLQLLKTQPGEKVSWVVDGEKITVTPRYRDHVKEREERIAERKRFEKRIQIKLLIFLILLLVIAKVCQILGIL